MRIVKLGSHSPYEAFQKYGLHDGESPLAGIVMGMVMEMLDSLGYEATPIANIHNCAIAKLLHQPSGREIDIGQVAREHGIDLEESPDAVRRALLAAGLQDVVSALDRLDEEVVCVPDLPSVVIVRHPNRGEIIDVHLFASAQEAARFALAHEDEDLDVAVPVPEDERKGGARYRHVLLPEELEELTGSSEE